MVSRKTPHVLKYVLELNQPFALAYYYDPTDEMAAWRARRDELIRESRERQFERNPAM
jgi:hypothetical protein